MVFCLEIFPTEPARFAGPSRSGTGPHLPPPRKQRMWIRSSSSSSLYLAVPSLFDSSLNQVSRPPAITGSDRTRKRTLASRDFTLPNNVACAVDADTCAVVENGKRPSAKQQVFSSSHRVAKYHNGNDATPDSWSATNSTKQSSTPGRSPLTAFSPASYSSVSELNQRYSARSNAGEVKFHFGPNARECTWTPTAGSSFFPKIAPYNNDSQVKANALYMFEKISEEFAMCNEQIEFLAQQIMEKHSLVDPEPCGVPFQEAIITYGRVVVQKLTNGGKGIFLEGSRSLSHGRVVDLELGEMEYSVFPGQVCVVKATNPTGHKLVAESIYTSATLPLPNSLPQFTRKEGSLQLVVAAGPFTQLDTLNYQPLEDLIKYIVQHKPHVVILIGPFIDVMHPHILEGTLAETFETHFEKMVEKIMEPLKSLQTQVVMVPSWRDVHHQPIFPTPPFAPRKTPKNMHFISDPSTVSIQGLVVGVTSLDVIKDLSANESARSSGTVSRLHRLACHILSQQCFYPLYPPLLGLNVDSELFGAHGHLVVTPHILILPSELRHFAFVSEGCLVLNPEHLSRGMIGGTFARLDVPPPTSEDCQTFADSISCNIVSI